MEKNKEITLAEFARRSGLSTSQIRRKIEKGEITSRQGYKHRYIPVSELEELANKGRIIKQP